MATTVGNILRLSRAGIVLAQHGVRFVPAATKVPFARRLTCGGITSMRIGDGVASCDLKRADRIVYDCL